MKEPLHIVAEIRGFIANHKPLRFPHQEQIILDFLNELETTLTPVVEEPIVEEVVVEETVVEETSIVEEVAVKEVAVKAPKRNAKKK
jgi:hypothetical protein